MPDEIDLVQEHLDLEMASLIRHAARQAAEIPVGKPGQCSECDEHKPRLVRGVCAPCRDERLR